MCSHTGSKSELHRVTCLSEDQTTCNRHGTHNKLRLRALDGSVWVGRFREDYIAGDGSHRRRQCSVVLSAVRDLGKREASRRLSERLAEINQGRHKQEVMLSFERFALERFEPNIYPTLRVSTANGYRWTIRRYLLRSWAGWLCRRSARRMYRCLSLRSRRGLLRVLFCLFGIVCGKCSAWRKVGATLCRIQPMRCSYPRCATCVRRSCSRRSKCADCSKSCRSRIARWLW